VLETLLNSAGYLTSWFRDQFAGVESNSELDNAAARIPPGCDGLLTLPYWNSVQSPYWDPLATGATVGWRGSHTPAHLYRSLLEGVAYELRLQLAGLENATGHPVTSLRAVGAARTAACGSRSSPTSHGARSCSAARTRSARRVPPSWPLPMCPTAATQEVLPRRPRWPGRCGS
jgi:xylulokinase